MLLLAWAMLIVLIIIFFALAFYMISIWPYTSGLTPPFVPSNKKLVDLIVSTLSPEPHSIMYELGAGDMRISLAAWRQEPQARYIGLEKHFFPRTLARYYIWRAGAQKYISAREVDFYYANLSDATHIYCYLFPKAMQRLHEKFMRELRPGTVVVSLDFHIENKEPERTIDLRPYNLRLGKNLYVYRY